jgi:hypothetical protein
MKPEDKKKLQDAWRKATDRNPDADKPLQGPYGKNGEIKPWIGRDGTPVTPRKLMESALASEHTYQATDDYLAEFPTVTLDDIIRENFEKPAPKGTGPKP